MTNEGLPPDNISNPEPQMDKEGYTEHYETLDDMDLMPGDTVSLSSGEAVTVQEIFPASEAKGHKQKELQDGFLIVDYKAGAEDTDKQRKAIPIQALLAQQEHITGIERPKLSRDELLEAVDSTERLNRMVGDSSNANARLSLENDYSHEKWLREFGNSDLHTETITQFEEDYPNIDIKDYIQSRNNDSYQPENSFLKRRELTENQRQEILELAHEKTFSPRGSTRETTVYETIQKRDAKDETGYRKWAKKYIDSWADIELERAGNKVPRLSRRDVWKTVVDDIKKPKESEVVKDETSRKVSVSTRQVNSREQRTVAKPPVKRVGPPPPPKRKGPPPVPKRKGSPPKRPLK
jgi:hypothetical protein